MAFKYLSIIFITAITVLLSQVTCANTSQSDKNIYIIAEQWPGLSEADGSGLYFDLFKKIYRPHGITIHFEIHPLLRGIASINRGEKADVMLTDWNKHYLVDDGLYQVDKIIIPQHAIFAEYVEAVFYPSSNDNWKSITQNKAARISWIRGYHYQTSLNLSEPNITEINKGEQGLKMLIKGNIDCYLNTRRQLQQLMANEPYNTIPWRKELVLMRKLYPIFHNNQRGRYYASIYDKTMSAMIKTGEIFTLYQAYNENYNDALNEEMGPTH